MHWPVATSHARGCFIQTRKSASRDDARQEPYAVVPHVRTCAGAGSKLRSYRDRFCCSGYVLSHMCEEVPAKPGTFRASAA